MLLNVDPHHWLDEDGTDPDAHPKLSRKLDRVARTGDDRLLALCPMCAKEEMLISNWRTTFWAEDRLNSEVVLQ